MSQNTAALTLLADRLQARRDGLLQRWRTAIGKDPATSSGAALPAKELNDHIPALLSAFEQQLRGVAADSIEPAAAHGLQRWQQGYDLREVIHELSTLNEIVVAEVHGNVDLDTAALSEAGQTWARACGQCIEASVAQYFKLQQQEADCQVRDLESALREIQLVETSRADLWRQAAHDLRGNLGVVANATVGLSQSNLREANRDTFVRILMRNVTSLHHLLNDVTDLARLQAGRETRRVEPLDISTLLQQLCEGVRAMAQERHLFLHCSGPEGFAVDGDEVKIRRIAQNLILNAVKYTGTGGVTVSWGDSAGNDPKRWELCIKDTGPGIQGGSDATLAKALESASKQPASYDLKSIAVSQPREQTTLEHDVQGEGLGLSIVKRLCELLDATIELKSTAEVGTTFRILFPRNYPAGDSIS